MALQTNYDKLHPLFDFNNGGGVLFPFVMAPTALAAGAEGIDLDGDTGATADTNALVFVAPFPMRLITAQAMAVADANGNKAAAASTEPIITLGHGFTASIDGGSIIGTITCDLTGNLGKAWTSGSGITQVDLATGDTIAAYLTTKGVSATSANADGAAKVVLWLAVQNAPA